MRSAAVAPRSTAAYARRHHPLRTRLAEPLLPIYFTGAIEPQSRRPLEADAAAAIFSGDTDAHRRGKPGSSLVR